MQKQLGLSNWGPLLDHGVGFVFDNYYYYCQTGDTTHLAETLPRLLRSFDYLTTLMNPADSLLPVENLGIPSVWIDHHGYKKSRHKILAFNLYVSAMCRTPSRGQHRPCVLSVRTTARVHIGTSPRHTG